MYAVKTTHQVSELEGALLDAAVAKAEGVAVGIECWMTNPPKPGCVWPKDENGKFNFRAPPYAPSTSWSMAAPIIERQRMEVIPPNASLRLWQVYCGLSGQFGPTPLIAAMRAYVASKFGDTVGLP